MESVKRLIPKLTPILRVFLGVLFVYAGVAKLTDVSAFAAQIQHFGFENAALARALALYLPFVEITCGLALIVRRFTLGALVLYITLLLAFEATLVHAWQIGYSGGCGCFGKFFGGSSIQAAFVRNLGLFAVAGLLLAHEVFLSKKVLR